MCTWEQWPREGEVTRKKGSKKKLSQLFLLSAPVGGGVGQGNRRSEVTTRLLALPGHL
jgi:hypothetical protein